VLPDTNTDTNADTNAFANANADTYTYTHHNISTGAYPSLVVNEH
jgi:hypothetical protein